MFTEIFSSILLLVSLAAYVFLFLKLKESERNQAALRDRVEKIVRVVEQIASAAPAGARDELTEVVRQALAASEDARDGLGVLRRELADMRAQHARDTAAVAETAAANRAANDAALAEMRRLGAKSEHSGAAEAAADAELARKRLRMFP